MNKQIETEILGFISQEQYSELTERLSRQLGNIKSMKRLAIQVNSEANQYLDTRIRITNGQAAIMQKHGHWESGVKEEIEIDIPSRAIDILMIWKVLNNLVPEEGKTAQIMQLNSVTMNLRDEFEVKLTHQFGRSDRYSYEVEALKEGLDPMAATAELNLPIDNSIKDAKFWSEFSENVNIKVGSLTEIELLQMIEGSLK